MLPRAINGRLHLYLLGELDLTVVTPDHLNEIESRMNTTPRKCLGFMTPQLASRTLPYPPVTLRLEPVPDIAMG